jgi:hypothetical protein
VRSESTRADAVPDRLIHVSPARGGGKHESKRRDGDEQHAIRPHSPT